MDPISAGIITGGAGLAGTYLQNQASSAQALRMMDFQRDMSGSAHQREVADLRAAGLNPILSATGSGASTPTGAMAQMSDMSTGISKGMETAIAVKQQNKDFAQKDAQISNTEADTKNKEYSADLIKNQSAATAKEIEQKTWQNTLMRETIESQIKKAKAEGDFAKIKEIMGVVNSGASTANQLLNPLNKIGKPAGKVYDYFLGKP